MAQPRAYSSFKTLQCISFFKQYNKMKRLYNNIQMMSFPFAYKVNYMNAIWTVVAQFFFNKSVFL